MNLARDQQLWYFASQRFRARTSSLQWFLKRNCSVSPAQLAWVYASLCVVSLGIGVVFWFQGATLVMPFAWVELLVVGASFWVYARHATDGEKDLAGRGAGG